MRDKLIHEYFGINYRIVRETIVRVIPEVKCNVEKILAKEGL